MTDDATVLIVDDEKHTRDGLRLALEDDYEVYTASDQAGALEILKNDRVDVLVTDLRLGADDGMEVIDAALALGSPPLTIMMTAYGSVETAGEAMKRGAYHFINKPVIIDELEILIRRGLQSRRMEAENKNLRRQVEKKFSIASLIGKSGPMERVFETLEQVAPTRATVLIEGESGTGKELAAHAIHNLSGRPKDKLVIVHCAGFNEQLLESELFGHERGAFTGASERRVGRLEQASGGTLFLDEIGEINHNTQVKLLRALGERTIERVGGNTPIKIDIRVVAATNKNLAKMVEDGDFREDLYFRLNVVRVVMPPLRERREDILLLAKAFLKEFAEENGKPVKDLSDEAVAALLRYGWPGNVRELRTAIEHGVVMSNAAKVTPRHLPEPVRECHAAISPKPATADPGTPAPVPAAGSPDDLDLHAMERRLIRLALERAGGNRTEAAKLLGISRRTLHRKLNTLQEGAEHE
ncbi:sigma-54 dependent transcriptional regulator [soil metagenome]